MPGAFIQRDLSAVFNTADFATTATVDGVHVVNGIFENASAEVSTEDERVVMVQEATFICPTSAPVSIGSSLVIDGVSYVAKTPDHDGTGVTTWMMKRIR
jgi:hypothetical protein